MTKIDEIIEDAIENCNMDCDTCGFDSVCGKIKNDIGYMKACGQNNGQIFDQILEQLNEEI